ncbi:MAG: D-alanyl-D-alanine carboxypeptidase family protein [Deltaproteobacteria bacterium]|nr:D-alanyl-D-alanine carboxypeptidase family protein [Deltaproteobacteria bacterium]
MGWSAAIRLFGVALAALLSACSAAAPNGSAEYSVDGLGEGEAEAPEDAIDTTSDAITSSVNCDTTTMTAYKAGSPYSIEVITVGGKKISKPTGHAFLKWQKAATAAGVTLTLSSGFRTKSEQQYFYSCYVNCNCNSCNPADKPGYSKHQSGNAIDVGTNNWSWVKSHAAAYGFTGISSEKWHFIYYGGDPGGPCGSGGGGGTDPVEDHPSCYSSTLAKTMPDNACVQSKNDHQWYQCKDGDWVDRYSDPEKCSSENPL